MHFYHRTTPAFWQAVQALSPTAKRGYAPTSALTRPVFARREREVRTNRCCTPFFPPFFGKKGGAVRVGHVPPPPSGGVPSSCRRSGKIASGNFILGNYEFLPAFDAKSGVKVPIGASAAGVPGLDFAPGQMNCPCAKVLCLRPKTLVRRTRGGAFGP